MVCFLVVRMASSSASMLSSWSCWGPRVAPAVGECAGDLHLRGGGDGGVVLTVPTEAEARFVHEIGGGGGDVAEAEHVLVALTVVAGLGESCAAYAEVGEIVYVCAVAGDEGVFGAELPVEPCCCEPETLRRCYVGDSVDGVAGAIEGDGVDYGEVVDAAMLEGEGEVAAYFAHGASELEAVTLLADGGFAGGEGISGVEPRAADGGEERAVVGFLAGLGVNLDAATVEGGLSELGGVTGRG